MSQHFHLLLLVIVGQLEELLVAGLGHRVTEVVVGVASDSSSQVHVLLHHGYSVGVNRAQVGVFEDANEVGLRALLESLQGVGGESEVVVNTAADISDESLEWSSWKQQTCGLLVSLDLSEGDGSWSEFDFLLVTIGLLDALGGSSGLFVGLGCLGSSHLGLRRNLRGSVLLFWHFVRLTFKF